MRPTLNKVIVKRLPDKEITTQGNIILPNAGPRNTSRGEVIAVGVKYTHDGEMYSTPFDVGSVVVYTTKQAGKLDSGPDHYYVEIHNILYVE